MLSALLRPAKRRLQIIIVWTVVIAMGILASRLSSLLTRSRTEHPVTMDKSDRVAAGEQKVIDYIASHVHVQFEVVNNFISDSESQASLTLENRGTEKIVHGRWEIYFYQMSMLESNTMSDTGALIHKGQFRAFHVNGGLHKIQPTESFPGLAPGEKCSIVLNCRGKSIARTDSMPNWYVAHEGLVPKVLQNTADEQLRFVGSFDQPSKWKRYRNDRYDPYTPEVRFEKHEAKDLGESVLPVIPQVLSAQFKKAGVPFSKSQWVVHSDAEISKPAQYLSEKSGIPVSSAQPENHFIQITLGKVEMPDSFTGHADEAYALVVDSEKPSIVIKGNSEAGVFYGVQTLLQILPDEPNKEIPVVSIRDAPRYMYRGIMLDVSRNFFPPEEILHIIDLMAVLKMNRLHLHLTDDEGWRLEIPGLPELTEIGAKRSHDPSQKSSLMPAYGSGPDTTTSGSGYYSVADYQKILRYAASHHVIVIPEIDIPGHSQAAIVSMFNRYQRFKEEGKLEAAEEFLLSDLGDKGKYKSVQSYINNAVNPCMDSTYRFIEHVMKQIQEIHRDVQPLETFHFGGDEVPRKAFSTSPICKGFMALNDVQDMKELKHYFVERVARIANKLNLNLQGWEDGFFGQYHKPYALSTLQGDQRKDVFVNGWLNSWGRGTEHRAYKLANAGYKVIMSQATHLYFDHPHEPDPEERGLYWATRHIDIAKVFNFMPERLYDNMDVDRHGKAMDKDEACQTKLVECLELKEKQNIIGLSGQVWTETIRKREHLEEMLCPRIVALSERAWHKADWEEESDRHVRNRKRSEDWQAFANTLGYSFLRRLDEMDVVYYLPPPGVHVSDQGTVEVRSLFPGLTVEVSVDDGKTWSKFDPKMQINGRVLFATSSSKGRRSRIVPVHINSNNTQ